MGRRAARALRPLAVLRQQMPLLRLQQPCPLGDRPGGVARRFARRPGARGAAAPRTDADLDILRRWNSLADGPGDGRRGHRFRARTLARGRRHRDHARGQPQFGRGGALRRSRGGGSQPPLARAAELRRRRPRFPRPRAFGSRGPRRAGNCAAAFRARQLRPDLCLARRNGGEMGRDACAGAFARHVAPLALPADHRARHALRQHGRAGASSSRSMPTRPRRSTS